MELRQLRKRKPSEAPNKPNKRQVFTVPRQASAKAILSHNAAESPLLRLPAEIRQGIWREVLGDRSIHLEPRHITSGRSASEQQTMAWKHLICAAPRAEVEEYEHWKATWAGELPSTSIYRDPCHDHCLPEHFGIRMLLEPDQADKDRRLRLELLRSCRQVYAEANRILWKTNTFVFNESHTFNTFFQSRPYFQKQLITKLRIQMVLHNRKPLSWERRLSMPTIKSLQGLRTLHIRITHSILTPASAWPTWGWSTNHSLFDVLQLQLLPLENVTVIMSEGRVIMSRGPVILPKGHLIMEEGVWNPFKGDVWPFPLDGALGKDEVVAAEGLRNQFLDPNGLEIWKQKIKTRKRGE